jgi:hypothetical protein
VNRETDELLINSLRKVLSGPGADVLAALDELGWSEVADTNPVGAGNLLFYEQGRAAVWSRALDHAVLAELAPVLDQPAARRAMLYPLPGAEILTAGAPTGLVIGPSLDGIDEVVAPVTDPNGDTDSGADAVALAVLPVGELNSSPADGFEPAGRWRTARLAPNWSATTIPAADTWPVALAAGRRALTAELIGVCEAMMRLAIEHVSTRHQYGRPIASNQVVRHRLAHAHTQIAAADSLLDAAWDDRAGWSAAIAKAQAGQAYELTARHCMQVCGAIGLTDEHTLHLFVERGAVLNALLGSTSSLDRALGSALLGGLPPPTPVRL